MSAARTKQAQAPYATRVEIPKACAISGRSLLSESLGVPSSSAEAKEEAVADGGWKLRRRELEQ